MLAVHECYPGHHTHRVKTIASALPRAFKLTHIMAPGGLVSEGLAHFAESFLEDAWDDPLYPLFVSYRRYHTALRVQAELDLFVHGKPPEAVLRMYEERLGFSRAVARGQVEFHRMWPGYMTVYHVGERRVADVYRGFKGKGFFQAALSLGFCTLEGLERYLRSSETTRKAILQLQMSPGPAG